ncbi:MAG: hypothetical protein JWO05_326 [Gemmatimonadetes bacterium]|nr:hypothetical protein [Gemmatimonadota bacterium]
MKIHAIPMLCGVLMLPAALAAQQPAKRRQAPIEIRGQVPTPQVVTVRPREVPAYDRRVLVPAFYDHDFWPSILPGYAIVRRDGTLGGTSLAMDTSGTGVTGGASSGGGEPIVVALNRDLIVPPKPAAPAVSTAPRPATVAPVVERPMAIVQERWCTPRWWCPKPRVVTPKVKADSTKADTSKARPGTVPAPKP